MSTFIPVKTKQLPSARALLWLPVICALLAVASCGGQKDDKTNADTKAKGQDRMSDHKFDDLPAGDYRRVKIEIIAETQSAADKAYLKELQGFAEMEYQGPGGSPIYYSFDGKGKGKQTISQPDTDAMIMKFSYSQKGPNYELVTLTYDGGMQVECEVLEISQNKLVLRETMIMADAVEGVTQTLTNSLSAIWTLEPSQLPE